MPSSSNATPLHVCLVSNTAWSIYNYRLGLLTALRAAGARITIIAPEDRTFAPLQAMGCDCIDLKLASKGTSPVQDLGTLLSLFWHYRRLSPDVVFHYTIKANIYGTLAAAAARVPSVAITTGLGYVFLHANRAAKIAQTLYRLAFRFPREVWFLNPDDRTAFLDRNLLAHPERARLLRGEGVDLTRFAVMPKPVNDMPPTDDRDDVHADLSAVAHVDCQTNVQTGLDTHHGVAPHTDSGTRVGDTAVVAPFRFLLIGRLLWDKGVGEFIDAARRLKALYPQARWQLLGPVGVANPSAISRAEVQAWVDEGLVEYLGEAEDVRPSIAAADCIVLPSYREGVPRTLLEAAAMGRMAIATRVPGCIEVVEDGVNGILCKARDATDLADAMARVLRLTPTQRVTMEVAARRKAETEFDEKVVLGMYQQTLQSISDKTISLTGNPI